jgi:hypothetical protein
MGWNRLSLNRYECGEIVRVFKPGSTELEAIYTDDERSWQLPNPLVANASGHLPDIWIEDA